MKEKIINIIRDGWNENKPVCEVIRNIENATGLYRKYAVEQFTKLVFVSMPSSKRK